MPRIGDLVRSTTGVWISHGVTLLLLGALAGCGNDDSTPAQSSLTAIDIALEPDATMLEHASAANARLRSVYTAGFALDEAHHPHITMLQRFVRTADLDKVYAAADAVLASEKPATWQARGNQVLLHPLAARRPRRDRHRVQ